MAAERKTEASCRPDASRHATCVAARRLVARMLPFVVATYLFPAAILALDLRQPLAQLHHTSWTAKDGLTGAALCLAQTADGYLWVGTSDGLYRFDGVQFERFQPQGGQLQSVSTSALLAVPDGGLWVGYSRGGASFVGQDGRVVNYSERDSGFPVGKVRSFARDHDGTVWVAAVGGVARLEGNRWHRLRKDWNFPNLSGWRLFVDRQGTLWVAAASPDGILYLPKGAKTFRHTGIKTLALGLAHAKDGTIVFTDNGVDTEGPAYALPSEPDEARDPWRVFDLPGQQLAVDRDGGLWVAGFGIARVHLPERPRARSDPVIPPRIEQFARAQGLSGSVVSDVLEDREGNIWVTTEGGLDRFRRRNLSWERHRESSLGVSLVAGNDGDVWALSTSERPWLQRVQDRTVVQGAPEGLLMGHRAADGSIWLSANGSFWRWLDGRFSKVDPPDVVRVKGFRFTVVSATEDRTGRLWAAIGGVGQFHHKDGKWTFVEILAGRPDLTAIAAHTDADDRVWLAYREELAAVKDGKVRVYTAKDGLAVGPLIALGGRDRQVWVGGESGLAFSTGDRFHAVRVAGGSGFGMVTSILVSSHDGLWLTAGAAILHIPEPEVQAFMRDPAHRVSYEVFDLVSDLPESLLTRNSGVWYPTAAQGSDGLLWFATTHGIARVDTRRIVKNPLPPPVVIRSIVGDDKVYAPRGTPVLPPLTKSIRIDYTALSLSIPERVKFRYRLDGWETEWHDVGDRRVAFYTELGPGTYGFRVLASNNDGVWNEVGTTLAFTVAPAWFQTTWFRALVVGSVVGLMVALYQVRVRQVASALSARFDERLDERTRLARELHDTLLQTVQGSKMLADGALHHPTDLDRMRGAMGQLSVWLAQAGEEGRAVLNALRTSADEVNDLAAAFQKAAESPTKPAAMEVSVSVKGEPRDLHPIVRDELYHIGYEAMRNAWLHSAGTQLQVEIDYTHDVTMKVTDNGVGIAPAIAEKGRDGRFGLRGMRERAARIGATLTIDSCTSGTLITVVVPARRAFRGAKSAARPSRD